MGSVTGLDREARAVFEAPLVIQDARHGQRKALRRVGETMRLGIGQAVGDLCRAIAGCADAAADGGGLGGHEVGLRLR